MLKTRIEHLNLVSLIQQMFTRYFTLVRSTVVELYFDVIYNVL